MGVPAWAIAIFSIVGVLTLCGIIYSCWRGRRRRQYTAATRKGLEVKYEQLLQERDERLDMEVKKRKAEEEDTSAGSQVWFSRYVHHGRLHHWVLVIDGTKYELRRDKATGKYIYNVAEWTIDREKREAALAERKIPEVDTYYVCLIGWTQLPRNQLTAVCEQVMSQFGSYNLFWNNCQDFLQQFADEVISRKALDWSWFRENTKTEYQENQALPPPPEAMIAASEAAMVQQQLQQIQQQNMQNQQQIQNNINLNNSQLMAQNVQLNAVNMQMNQMNLMMTNPAINPAINPAMMAGTAGDPC